MVIITILNLWAFYLDCSEQGGVLAPFFTIDELGDDKLVVEDDWGVHFGLDVFYSSRIFLGKDALIELDGFLLDFWKKMPIWWQNFHCKG